MTSIKTCLPCKQHALKMPPTSLLRQGSASNRRNTVNRRSAVERLEESKANYVKSECVLDCKQEFKHSMHLQVSKAPDLLLKSPLVPLAAPLVNLRPKSPAPVRARAKSQSEVRDSPTRRRISLCRRNSARSIEAAVDLESQLKRLISADTQPIQQAETGQKVRRGYSDPVNRQCCPSATSYNIHKSMPDLSRRRPQLDPRPLPSSSSSDSSEHFFRVTPRNSLRCLPRPQCRSGRLDSDTSDDDEPDPPPSLPPAPPECYLFRRPVLRSKSDVGSCRSLTRRSERRRNSYGGPELERFFNMLGLDSSVWQRLTSPAECGSSSPPRFFESGSSLQSEDYRSNFGSDDSQRPAPECVGLLNRQLKELSPGETSIVEKNARVIKWLYNCRKAQGTLDT